MEYKYCFPVRYSSPPLMTVDDNCGNGKGANGTVIIGPVDTVGTGSTIGIVDVVMNDTGYDYHAYPYGDKVVVEEFGQIDVNPQFSEQTLTMIFHTQMVIL